MKITNFLTHKFLVVSIFLLLLASILQPLTALHAEDVTITTYYPAPYSNYKQLQVQNQDENTNITEFTTKLINAGINIITDYNDLSYTPGIFWSTLVNNPDKPKAGIWMYEATAGSKLIFGTSNDYVTGITSTGLVLDQNGKVGLGTAAPNEQLELTGNLRLPPTTATTGSLFVGPDRFLHNYGTNNTFLGIQSGNFTMTGTGENTGVGSQALSSNTTGSSNSAMGYRALYSNTEGAQNTAFGWLALMYNTTGSSNTALGNQASGGYGNETGSYNTTAGTTAMGLNPSTGSDNTAVGYQALSSNTSGFSNTALGAKALYYILAGQSNTALGANTFSVFNDTNYSANVVVGNSAGQNATGDFGVFLGYQAGQNEAGSNKLYIDNSNIAPTSSSGPLIYGDFSTDIIQINGRLGVGTAPHPTSNYRLTLPDMGSTTNPAGQGIAQPDPLPASQTASASAWKTYSSIRWKENILPIPDALEKVLRLRGVTYTRKESKKREVGMIAEEVGKVFPEIVDYEKNGTDAIGMSYDRLVAVLVEAVKELKVENEALKKRVILLKENINK